MNIVIIMGNLTADPELRYTPKGTAVSQFSIAVNRKWKDNEGNLKEEVSFIMCNAFGKTAETISQYFKKGGQILVHGRLRQETWEDKQSGAKRSALKVMVEGFDFTGRNSGSGGEERQPAARSQRQAEAPAQEAPPDNPDYNDDVPFN